MTELATSLVATEADRLAQAESLVRAFAGWHIAPSRTETLELAGSGSVVLTLPSLHVTAVSAVRVDGVAVSAESFAWSEAGILTGLGVSWHGRVSVELSHGYPEVPPEVTAVVQAIAQRALDNPRSLSGDRVGPFSRDYSTSAPMGFLGPELEVLNRYSLPARP